MRDGNCICHVWISKLWSYMHAYVQRTCSWFAAMHKHTINFMQNKQQILCVNVALHTYRISVCLQQTYMCFGYLISLRASYYNTGRNCSFVLQQRGRLLCGSCLRAYIQQRYRSFNAPRSDRIHFSDMHRDTNLIATQISIVVYIYRIVQGWWRYRGE